MRTHVLTQTHTHPLTGTPHTRRSPTHHRGIHTTHRAHTRHTHSTPQTHTPHTDTPQAHAPHADTTPPAHVVRGALGGNKVLHMEGLQQQADPPALSVPPAGPCPVSGTTHLSRRAHLTDSPVCRPRAAPGTCSEKPPSCRLAHGSHKGAA